MRFMFAAAVLLASATGGPAGAVPGVDDRSRDLARLVGTWNCQGSAPGNTSVETYAAAADGSFVLENRVRASTGRVGVVIETFRYDAAAGAWNLAARQNAFFGGLQLRGGSWSSPTWILSGTEVVSDKPRAVRIVYTDLGPDSFRREHQAQTPAGWQDDAALLCRRSAPASVAAAATFTPSAAASAASPASAAIPTQSPAATSSPGAAGPVPAMPSTPVASLTPRPARDVAWKFATPSQAATAAPARDRAYDLIGSWACETIARDPATHTYSRERDGSLHLLNHLELGGRTFEIDEIYRYDAAAGRWTNDTEHGAYRGTARRWLGAEWTFDGTARERGKSFPVRMQYKTVGASAFRRDFQKPSGLQWTTYASETCARTAVGFRN